MITEGYHYVTDLSSAPDWWPWPNARKYTLTRSVRYRSGNTGLHIYVGAGFKFDGPTGIPLIGKRTRSLMEAAVFHDALYEPQGLVIVYAFDDNPRIKRRRADNVFDEISKADGAPWFLRYVSKKMIGWFGGKFWDDDVKYLAEENQVTTE